MNKTPPFSTLSNVFNLPKMNTDVPSNLDDFLMIIRQRLTPVIEQLINHDLDKLFHILYRIDIDDQLTAKAFEKGIPRKIAQDLVERIIEREIKKSATQEFFKQQNND